MKPLIFDLPLPINIANTSMHHMVKHRAKVAYWRELDLLLAAGKLPAPPKKPLERVMIRATMYCGAHMDDGNAAHRVEKWPCDWLKTRGFIKDDRRKFLRWEGYPSQVVSRSAPYRVVLTLTPVENFDALSPG